MSISVSVAAEADLRDWQLFVDRSPDAGPLHHAGWYGVLRDAYAVAPTFFITREGGKVCGIMPMYRSRSVFTGQHYTTLEGGILADSTDVSTRLLDTAKALRDRPGVRYVQIRGGTIDDIAPVAIPTVHTIVATRNGVDATWAAIRPKTRWGIRQAEKEALRVELDPQLERLQAFHVLYAEHMRELGTPVFGAATFEAMKRHLGPARLRLYLLKDRERLVGGMLCVVHGTRWTDLYAIVRRSRTSEFANYLLYWGVIRDAAQHGVDEFDLGKSTPGSTVLLFKHKWGGVDVNVPYRFYPGTGERATKMRLLGETREKGLRQRIWSTLPLPICNLAGPVIRRDLPFL